MCELVCREQLPTVLLQGLALSGFVGLAALSINACVNILNICMCVLKCLYIVSLCIHICVCTFVYIILECVISNHVNYKHSICMCFYVHEILDLCIIYIVCCYILYNVYVHVCVYVQ